MYLSSLQRWSRSAQPEYVYNVLNATGRGATKAKKDQTRLVAGARRRRSSIGIHQYRHVAIGRNRLLDQNLGPVCLKLLGFGHTGYRQQ